MPANIFATPRDAVKLATPRASAGTSTRRRLLSRVPRSTTPNHASELAPAHSAAHERHRERPMTDELYRPGLEGIIAGETAISTIAGGLQYRGYTIEQAASEASFDEVAYLLLLGK